LNRKACYLEHGTVDRIAPRIIDFPTQTSKVLKRGPNNSIVVNSEILRRVVQEEQNPAAHGPHVIIASEPTTNNEPGWYQLLNHEIIMVDTVYKGNIRTISLGGDTFARSPGFDFSIVPEGPDTELNNPGPPPDDSNPFPPPGNSAQQPNQPDDPTAILSSLSNLQNVDGGFGTKSADVMRLIRPLSPSSAVQLLGRYNTNIAAALLAWLWMVMWGGIKAITLVDKLNKWIRQNAPGDLNVDVIQSKLYETSSSSD